MCAKAIIFQAKAVGLKGALQQNDILLQRNFFLCLCQKRQNVMSRKDSGGRVAKLKLKTIEIKSNYFSEKKIDIFHEKSLRIRRFHCKKCRRQFS